MASEGADTVLLLCDYQNKILSGFGEDGAAAQAEYAATLAAAAHDANIPVVWVRVAFRPGAPEIPPSQKFLYALKEAGAVSQLEEGSEGAALHPVAAAAVGPDDVDVIKRRVGAFSGSDLAVVLAGLCGDSFGSPRLRRMYLAGVSTSGVVLSTVRAAGDMDIPMTVVSDACADRDDEVHRVLMEKVFPRHADVKTTAEVIELMKRK